MEKRKILVVGSGGREHAIIWKLAQSPLAGEIICAPGNAGIAALARTVPIAATDLDGQIRLAIEEKADLVFVAPDDPLALGLVDRLTDAGIPAFGPTRAAARIESSKAFAKQLMTEYGVPTARCQVFSDLDQALDAAASLPMPVWIKADGLALGKGAAVVHSVAEAQALLKSMMADGKFGDSGRTVVIEENMTGLEVTILAFTDGKTLRIMPASRDHKRIFSGDQGPNTGGMGAVAPVPLPPGMADRLQREIFAPILRGLRDLGSPFRGVLYLGLMLTPQGPRVIEFNARFGDPEAQAVLPLLQTDLLEIIDAILAGRLDQLTIHWSDQACCCVVAAAEGYPGQARKGDPVTGIDQVPADAMVFHAATARDAGGRLITAGGRILGVSALGSTLPEAITRAYQAIEPIRFHGRQMRDDIGRSTLTAGSWQAGETS